MKIDLHQNKQQPTTPSTQLEIELLHLFPQLQQILRHGFVSLPLDLNRPGRRTEQRGRRADGVGFESVGAAEGKENKCLARSRLA